MSLAFFIRNNFEKLPYELGKYISYIPYSYRPGIGKEYRKTKKEIKVFDELSHKQKKEFIFKKVKKIAEYSYKRIPFYKHHYDRNSFHPKELKLYSDINKIPIIDKSILSNWKLEERSNANLKSMKVNTGGSSGKPFSLLVPPKKMAIEWFHLHKAWDKQLGFKPSDLKLLVMGRSDVSNYAEYDFVRHSIKIDIYNSFKNVGDRLVQGFKNHIIKYLHGYPSAIYELANYCQGDDDLLSTIKSNLKGCILNSEYPFKYQRKIIEETFGVKTAAFYGHTEGCIMAYEVNVNKYKPLHTYGLAEAVSLDGQQHLVGTNFYNYASPLIRYNTEDIASEVECCDELLTFFSIEEGRKADFVYDKTRKKIPLTGLIFGRHHKLFDKCVHVQAKQALPGHLTILYLPKQGVEIKEPSELFDSNNVDIEFTFEKVDEPVRTPSGKVKLLV